MIWNALVILSPGFEETEAVTVIDVLRRASIPVTTASLSADQAVKGSHGITVMTDTQLSSTETSLYNVLVLPGGLQGVENMLASQEMLQLVKDIYRREGILAAVCAAPLVLDAAGVLGHTAFTCHPTVRHRLSDSTNLKSEPFVRSERIVTGRSAGCALNWAIALAEHLIAQIPDTFYAGLNCAESHLIK